MRLFGLLLLLTMATGVSAASFKVIVHESVAVQSLPKKTVSDFFLKKVTKWAGGATVVPVDQVEASAVREAFSKAVHGKPTSAIKSYWNQQIFAGRDVPPVEKKSDADVVAFVKANPGAIGYVSESAAADGVRVMNVN